MTEGHYITAISVLAGLMAAVAFWYSAVVLEYVREVLRKRRVNRQTARTAPEAPEQNMQKKPD